MSKCHLQVKNGEQEEVGHHSSLNLPRPYAPVISGDPRLGTPGGNKEGERGWGLGSE